MSITLVKQQLKKALALATAFAVAFCLTVGAPASAFASDLTAASVTAGSTKATTAIKAPSGKKYDKLVKNLTKRFSKGGKDAALNNDMVGAAFALNMLGKESKIDVAGIKKAYAADSSMGAGRTGKYIVMFCLAGQTKYAKSCISQMESRMVSGEDLYSAVFILMAYHMTGKKPSAAAPMTEKQLVEVITSEQQDSGVLCTWEDYQTTAQAVIALEGVSSAKAAQRKAVKALLAVQNSDGGFRAGSWSADSDVDTTGDTVLALYRYSKSSGDYAVARSLSKAAEFLVSKADSTLDGYENSGSWNELLTCATAFGGLVAAKSAGSLTFKMSKAKVAKIGKKKYTGKAIKPKPTVKYNGVKLKKGADYTLSYKNNKKVGTAKVIIKGKGNFKGSKTVKFKIVKKK